MGYHIGWIGALFRKIINFSNFQKILWPSHSASKIGPTKFYFASIRYYKSFSIYKIANNFLQYDINNIFTHTVRSRDKIWLECSFLMPNKMTINLFRNSKILPFSRIKYESNHKIVSFGHWFWNELHETVTLGIGLNHIIYLHGFNGLDFIFVRYH